MPTDIKYCNNCDNMNIFYQEDFGFGYSEKGSYGFNHKNLIWVCSVCGMPEEEEEGTYYDV